MSLETNDPMEETKVISEINLVIDKIEKMIEEKSFTIFDELKNVQMRIQKAIPSKIITLKEVESVVLPMVYRGSKSEFYENRKSRKTEFIHARKFLFLFARLLTNLSQERIGLLFGKNHATVKHNVDTLLSQMYIPQNKMTFDLCVKHFVECGYYIPLSIRQITDPSLQE
jgi:chromosomal replication initiation ATPase DnaA